MDADFLLPVLRLHFRHGDRPIGSAFFAESQGRRFLIDELWIAERRWSEPGLDLGFGLGVSGWRMSVSPVAQHRSV